MSYDVIGDVHGCYDELIELLGNLGYEQPASGAPYHPENRKPVFLGDLTDRGPHSLKVIEWVAKAVKEDRAYYVPGNHCDKLYRYFHGNPVKIKHGLETTVAELEKSSEKKQDQIKQAFISLYESAPLYLELDEGKLIVAHAGIKEKLIGQNKSKKLKGFVLYGDVTGETLPDGRPVRKDWAKQYQGKPWIVYGHTPVKEPRIFGRTINIDTGCVFGNKLTAFRYPEQTTISVPSSMPLDETRFHVYD
ncbi:MULTISPECIES: bis(5'-nucleosyl)-tetraphosphatase PrpE [Bacillus]|uniref:Bis(5'-nucleosyl)-tetraphosphatase n=2 Tax=Bacillus TaxID=1386 RepID=A0A0M3R939_9BACI|nr:MULTISPECIES: bis(5'-nucleosyl)-tetraphosphatase PrpE [Bacillus]ALC80756.1 bis(5'-nucleosyl)-tetraphosphatase [Bacillus gobiensis]MBP1079658.1 bis(5'-nucleosyl)-tetraphosphatase (symmetrical) [Bacillus capparidis]MED1095059.1 bis(5'-nucleosyl)-tetraphosphatase PrpE [Bacillus capparidis]